MSVKKTVAVDEAESVRNALIAEQIASREKGSKVPLPNGLRMAVKPAVSPVYQGMNVTTMLGDPGSILKDPKPGYKYVWKKRTDRQTAAWIRAGILRPVTADEVDTSNPLAEYVEDVMPGVEATKVVSWESHSLFEMPPKWVKKIYEAPEDIALQRIAANAEEFKGRVEDMTGGGMAGEFHVSNK